MVDVCRVLSAQAVRLVVNVYCYELCRVGAFILRIGHGLWMLLSRWVSGRNFVQLVQEALDALAYGFALLLEGLDLLLHLRQLRGLLVKKLLQGVGVLLGGGAGFALFFEQLDRAQNALFERVEVVGSKVQFGIVQSKGGHRGTSFIQGEIQLFFAQYSWFCTEEN